MLHELGFGHMIYPMVQAICPEMPFVCPEMAGPTLENVIEIQICTG